MIAFPHCSVPTPLTEFALILMLRKWHLFTAFRIDFKWLCVREQKTPTSSLRPCCPLAIWIKLDSRNQHGNGGQLLENMLLAIPSGTPLRFYTLSKLHSSLSLSLSLLNPPLSLFFGDYSTTWCLRSLPPSHSPSSCHHFFSFMTQKSMNFIREALATHSRHGQKLHLPDLDCNVLLEIHSVTR